MIDMHGERNSGGSEGRTEVVSVRKSQQETKGVVGAELEEEVLE